MPRTEGNMSSESKATSVTETTFEDTKKDEARDFADQDNTAVKTEDTVKRDPLTQETETQFPAGDSEDQMEYPHGLKLWTILGALCLSVFLVALDQTIISTAIPTITDHFNSIRDIGW